MKILNGVSSSDWHLGSLKNIFPDHISRQIKEISKIYKYCVENGIEHLFVPGDISNTSTIGDDALTPLIKLLLMFDSHVKTYYIAGNHDFESSKKTSLDLLKFLSDEGLFKNFHIFLEPECREIDGVLVNFMPFPSTVLPESKKPALNFVHIDVDGAIADNGKPLRVKTRHNLGNAHYTISGHVHKYQKLPKFIYNGNPYQRKFNEEMPKGFIDFKAGVSKGRMCLKHEFVNNRPEFELRTLRIETAKDFDRIVNSPNIAYSLKIDEGVIIPPDLTTKYLNIHSQHKGSSLLEVTQKLIDNQADVSVNLTAGLPKFLKGLNLGKAERTKALGLVNEAIQLLGL